jgi:hypothetical protein
MKRYIVAALAASLVVGGTATFLLLVISGNGPVAPPGFEWSESGSMWCTIRPADAGPESLAGDVCLVPDLQGALSFVGLGLLFTLAIFGVLLVGGLVVRLISGKLEPVTH